MFVDRGASDLVVHYGGTSVLQPTPDLIYKSQVVYASNGIFDRPILLDNLGVGHSQVILTSPGLAYHLDGGTHGRRHHGQILDDHIGRV